MKVHLASSATVWFGGRGQALTPPTSCGIHLKNVHVTCWADLVTCGSCLKTHDYINEGGTNEGTSSEGLSVGAVHQD